MYDNMPQLFTLFAIHISIGISRLDIEGGSGDAWNCNNKNSPNLTMEEQKKRGYDKMYTAILPFVELVYKRHTKMKEEINNEDPDEYYDNFFFVEVCEEFGDWIGKYLIATGFLPTMEEVERKVDTLFEKYMENDFLEVVQEQQAVPVAYVAELPPPDATRH